jgi:hypothetical protein
MPEYISGDKKQLFIIEDVPSNHVGIVKTIKIYKFNEESRVFELSEMLPLKLRDS